MMRLSGSVKLRWAFGLGDRIGVTTALLGFGLECGLGLADGAQPALTGAQRLGQLITAGIAVELVLGRIDRLGFGEDAFDLGREGGFALVHAPVAHGLVLRRVRLHLRAVERDPSERHEARGLAQPQAVEEERLERGEVTAPELADRLVVGTRLSGEIHEADIALQALLEFA